MMYLVKITYFRPHGTDGTEKSGLKTERIEVTEDELMKIRKSPFVRKLRILKKIKSKSN